MGYVLEEANEQLIRMFRMVVGKLATILIFLRLMEFDELAENIFKHTRFFQRTEQKVMLREGLIFSYSSDNFKSAMNYAFKGRIVHIEEDNLLIGYVTRPQLKNPNTVVFIFDQDFNDLKEMQRILDQCGYFIAKQDLNFNYKGSITKLYQMEPKFPVVLKFPMNKIRMFHITEKSILDKIMKIGLCAKDSRTTFSHQGNRIYLFITNDPEKCIPKLKEMLAKDKNKNVEDMIALEVSPNFNTDEEYFLDMAFVQIPKICYAVFTFNAIPRTHIKIFKE